MGSKVIGTAGHIDHGKSSLVRALTGIDPDRLDAEKERGITIDLGFAHLDLGGGSALSLVDVPGHERFVRSMVAGATGVDVALLAVAADEGVMPQTREHLDVLRLLGVEAGVLAVTKADLLPALGEEWGSLLEEDLDDLSQGNFLSSSRRIQVSSRTGAGLTELVEALRDASELAPSRRHDGPLFLPIDRAFAIKGFGTVVTGTVHAGSLRVEDEVDLVPGGPTGVRVRGLQTHGASREEVRAGQRAAVNLAGLPVEGLERGMVIGSTGQLPPTSMLDVELHLLPAAPRPLRSRSKLLLYLGTSQVVASVVLLGRQELEPGETGFAQLRLASPLAALPSQRFLLRGASTLQGRGRTLAGGTILSILPRKLRARRSPGSQLEVLLRGTEEERVEKLLADVGARGLTPPELVVLSALPRSTIDRSLQRLGARGAALCFDRERGAWVSGVLLGRLEAKSREAVAQHHLLHPLAQGLPREELRHRLGITDPKLFSRLVSHLEGQGLETAGEVIREEGHSPGGAEADRALEARVLGWLGRQGLSPPDVGALSKLEKEPEGRILAILRLLEGKGDVVRVAQSLYFHGAALSDLRHRLVSHLVATGEISTQEFKTLTGTTRKWLIPLGEYFDAEKVTLRVGDARRILRGAPEGWREWLGTAGRRGDET